MYGVKKINNNAVICRDSQNREMIAMGKGIGFGQLPREIPLSDIERTFYNVDPQYVEMSKTLPPDVLLFSTKMIETAANELPYSLSPNAAFTLADHIAFTIERAQKKIRVKMPLAYDVQQMYPNEYRVAEYIFQRTQREFQIGLPREEIVGIAMSLLNSQVFSDDPGGGGDRAAEDDSEMLEDVTAIIEEEFHLIVDRNSFNYSRYATHLQYLFERIHQGKALDTENFQMYRSVAEEAPRVAACVDKIADHICKEWQCELSDEEKLYLILHVNRVCDREGL